jgi:hypothetical protein
MEHPHCTILVASKRFSCATVSPTPELYFADANPLFFPASKRLSKSAQLNQGDPTNQAIFLQEIYAPPFGFFWPMDIGRHRGLYYQES